MSDSLSLREIQSDLYDMLVERAELQRDIEAAGDEIPLHLIETKMALEDAIKAYGLAKREKVDSIAWVRRRFNEQADSDEAEGKRLIARSKAGRAEADRLTEYTKDAMHAAGVKRIDGEHAALALEPNPVSVEVRDASLVPDALKKQSVALDCATWLQIIQIMDIASYTLKDGQQGHVMGQLRAVIKQAMQNSEAVASKPDIAAVLKCPVCRATKVRETCEACRKTGYAICQQCQGMKDGGENYSDADRINTACSACGGSGRATVPGAALKWTEKLSVR